MEENLFAYTVAPEPDSGLVYVPYLSLNRLESGAVTLTVRSANSPCGQIIELPRLQQLQLINGLLKALHGRADD